MGYQRHKGASVLTTNNPVMLITVCFLGFLTMKVGSRILARFRTPSGRCRFCPEITSIACELCQRYICNDCQKIHATVCVSGRVLTTKLVNHHLRAAALKRAS